jgi:hypothetical protein
VRLFRQFWSLWQPKLPKKRDGADWASGGTG